MDAFILAERFQSDLELSICSRKWDSALLFSLKFFVAIPNLIDSFHSKLMQGAHRQMERGSYTIPSVLLVSLGLSRKPSNNDRAFYYLCHFIRIINNGD